MSFIDRTLEGLRKAWQSSSFASSIAADLPEPDVPEIRAKIDACLALKGGEVSARQRAGELGRHYLEFNEEGRIRFLKLLAEHYGCDRAQVSETVDRYNRAEGEQACEEAIRNLRRILVPPRIELLKQFNALPQGVKFLVDMRAEIAGWSRDHPELKTVDRDLKDLLSSWFDIGFLELRAIDWRAPAALLEKLIDYEAVHAIRSWDDLKNRLEPDRRCFGFFHPRMPEEPLIFVEVALVNGIADNVHDLLDLEAPAVDPDKADTAIFYSISNCQAGLAGVSFGNFLIKRVVAELQKDLPNLKQFATLSPVPGYLRWLKHTMEERGDDLFIDDEARRVRDLSGNEKAPAGLMALLARSDWWQDETVLALLHPMLCRLVVYYLTQAKRGTGQGATAADPVAHFHLSNGARLQQVNWLADHSTNGLRQSAGIMVNYLYNLDLIDQNHEDYRAEGKVNTSSTVLKLRR